MNTPTSTTDPQIIDRPTHRLVRGEAPLLISIPHLGTSLPDEVRAQLLDVADLRQDTDWHLDELYGFATTLGASVLQAKVSRYVIDLNRPPTGESLYPGQTTTGLCPTETFRGEPLYPPGQTPDANEQARRLKHYWQPYHQQLQDELARLQALHGQVLLWEAHSIAGLLPRLFDGALPALNLGTADGRSCAPAITQAVMGVVAGSAYSHVLNGRFKGGYITRHYGQPHTGVHALQLEMCQHLYMDEDPPFAYDPKRATQVQAVLRPMLEAAMLALTAQP